MTKAKTAVSKKAHPSTIVKPRYRFWVTVTCIGALILWYILTIFMILGISGLIAGSEPDDTVDRLYGMLLGVQTTAPYVAGVVTAACCYWAFRALGVKRAALSSVVVAMLPVMILYIFMLIYELFPLLHYPVSAVVLGSFLLVSVGISLVWSIWLMKRAQELFPGRWSIVIAGLTPLAVIGLNYIHWLLVTQ